MKLDANSLRGKGPLIVSIIALSLLVLTIISIFYYPTENIEYYEDENGNVIEVREEEKVVEPIFYYGINGDSVNVETRAIDNGESLSVILTRYGFTPAAIHNVVQKSKGIFDVRSMRKGANYTALTAKDSTNKLQYLMYEINAIDFVKYSFMGDTVNVERVAREVVMERKTLHVFVRSSLWESIISAGGSAALVMGIENIFQWTVDFYGVKEGDSFSFIYDENFVEGKSIGVGNIIGVSYRQKGKSKYAFRFQNGKQTAYWDEDGRSLRRAFLKAPLRFSRISSKFTYRRLHPVHKVYKAHTGVDYAAPVGTPVESVADGVVIDKFYSSGGGNTLKIKHYVNNGAYQTAYLYLNAYAKGVTKGTRVSQGQVIGYVGSTGVSTGAHLDFRVWRNGKPMDPLKLGGETGDPLTGNTRTQYKEHIKEYLETLQTLERRAERELTDEKKREIDLRRQEQELEDKNIEKSSKEIDHEI